MEGLSPDSVDFLLPQCAALVGKNLQVVPLGIGNFSSIVCIRGKSVNPDCDNTTRIHGVVFVDWNLEPVS